MGTQVREIRRCGKRIALGLEDDPWLLLHLMIAGDCTGETRAKLTESPVLIVARRSNASATPKTRRIIARRARPQVGCRLIARFPVCSRRIGPGLAKS